MVLWKDWEGQGGVSSAGKEIPDVFLIKNIYCYYNKHFYAKHQEEVNIEGSYLIRASDTKKDSFALSVKARKSPRMKK